MLSKDSELLERAFQVFNAVYFENCLPEVVITIQSKPKAYGYITTSPIWKDGQMAYYELNITAEYLNRPIENVLATLQHEMCHLYAMVKGIRDTSQNGRYHNKRFKEIAEERGLQITYAEGIGYSVTSPTDSFIEVIKAHGLNEDIPHHRGMTGMLGPGGNGGVDGNGGGADGDGNPKPKKKKSSTRKYQCPICHMSVRATKDVWIICGECQKDMEKVEPD